MSTSSTPSPLDDELWFRAATTLRTQVSEAVWHSTFADVRPLPSPEDELVLAVTSTITRERIEDRYRPMVEAAVRDAGTDCPVRIVVDEPRVLDPPELDLVDTTEVSPASSLSRDPAPPPTPGRHQQQPSQLGDNLSERYTFETFVTGTSNRFAHAAALAVAETPGRSYNPLFIYGGAGLGKTHLLQAIVHYIGRNYPGFRVRYVSTESFMNEFIEAIRTTGQASFKRRYRDVDVLLVDDIQFMEGKEGLQEEFFHTFNSLHGAGRQVVLSSDRPPRSIATLEDRLRSRFEWGLITDIQPPDLETRLAILRKKTEVEGSRVPDDVLEFIATNIRNNIRELEGALIRVGAFASLTDEPLDIDLATKVLADIVTDGEPRPITIGRIIDATVSMFGFGHEELLGKRRHRALVTARQISMYVCRELTDLSYPSIAREFGNRDHTTVIHAVDKISKQMAERRQIYDQVTALIQDIKAP
ncbi:MAG: chromosomal replication initiator protein DnaA [Actinomycetia bacterium]|nr:chromosomal replication initiator protein DnaA [Actinomycetes bacterium]MCP4960822.1 chromosomal replication initiator protein DnaA [Actinomycetes bacterium]